jgi:tRNA-specific 2-thiouridylase
VLCNSRIKFGVLLDAALERGANRLATGHYARARSDEDGVRHLFKGVDKEKDQSYFLFDLDQSQLIRSVFPLGEKTKVEVRKDAADIGLDCRRSRESNELCFIPDQDYVRWIEERSGVDAFKTGPIVDIEGRELACHSGIHRYTVGQRKGLGIATGLPMYVVSIDSCSGRVVVGGREQAMSESMYVTNLNWIAGQPEARVFDADVKIRYNHGGARCAVEIEDGVAQVKFDEPQFAVTPGQAAVFYDGDEVIGGGFIGKGESVGCGT